MRVKLFFGGRSGAAPDRPRCWLDDQRGQLLLFSVIAMAVGSLLVGAFLDYLSVSFKVTNANKLNLEQHYAAEAAIQAVVRDLVEGQDALSGGYTVPTVSVNGYNVTPTVTAPTGATPLGVYGYIDPGTKAGLAQVDGHITYNFQMDNVQAGSYMQVNWPFAPDRRWTVALYKGSIGGGTLVASQQGNKSPGQLGVDGSLITGGTYYVAFTNDTGSSVSTSGFNSQGGVAFTWVYGLVYKDYQLTAQAGSEQVTAYVRQIPGPVSTAERQRVTIEYVTK